MTQAYHSAVAFASSPTFSEHVVTRAEYLESGSNASRRKFKDWKVDQKEKESEKAKELTKGKARRREDEDERAPSKKPARLRSRASVQTKGKARQP